MHQNNRIISWIISFLFSICMVISISYDQRDNWSLIIWRIKTYDQCIDHDDDSYNDRTLWSWMYYIQKRGSLFIRLKDSSKQWDRRKNIWSSSIAVPWSILIVLWLPIIFCISGLFNLWYYTTVWASFQWNLT